MPQWPFYLDFTALQTAIYFERQIKKAEVITNCTDRSYNCAFNSENMQIIRYSYHLFISFKQILFELIHL